MAGKIFINYRRGDDAGFTGRLFDFLERNFPSDQLFIDVDNIPAGADFVQVLEAQVDQCDVMLSVIGRGWIEARDEAGRRRLENPDDFVRIEIETALKLGKRVIPVLVNGADMPRTEVLPGALQSLARRNAVRLTHERFRMDAQGLVQSIELALREVAAAAKAAREAAAAERQRKVEQEQRKAAAAAARDAPAPVTTPSGVQATSVPTADTGRSVLQHVEPAGEVVGGSIVARPAAIVRSPKELAAGILFLILGALSYSITPDFGVGGTESKFATIKFVPRLLALLMLAFGALSLARGFLLRGPSLDRIGWQPLILLPAACILGAVILPYVGMPIALAVIGVICASATPAVRFDWRGLIGYTVAVSITFLVFTRVLKFPLPLVGSLLK